MGAPSFVFCAKGGYHERMQRRSLGRSISKRDPGPTLVPPGRTGRCRPLGRQATWYRQHRARPCKKRKDGAPRIPEREGKTRKERATCLGMTSNMVQAARTRPCKKRKDGAPRIPEREGKHGKSGPPAFVPESGLPGRYSPFQEIQSRVDWIILRRSKNMGGVAVVTEPCREWPARSKNARLIV